MLNKTDEPSICYKEIGVGSKHIGLAAGAPYQGVASRQMMKTIWFENSFFLLRFRFCWFFECKISAKSYRIQFPNNNIILFIFKYAWGTPARSCFIFSRKRLAPAASWTVSPGLSPELLLLLSPQTSSESLSRATFLSTTCWTLALHLAFLLWRQKPSWKSSIGIFHIRGQISCIDTHMRKFYIYIIYLIKFEYFNFNYQDHVQAKILLWGFF